MDSVDDFFDALTNSYTEQIERCFPRYREMLWALLDYLPNRNFENVLELGCGTGNLSTLIKHRYPDAKFTGVDVSQESLRECESRIGTTNVTLTACDFRSLDYPPESFDLILSSIAVHHVPPQDKRELFDQCYDWLSPAGSFAFADQFAGANQRIYERHISNWNQLSRDAGASTDEWKMWMEHQKDHDFHDCLRDQMDWLSASGFKTVDCVWRHLLWSVVLAEKENL